jgi:hypothetical protein
MSRSLHAVDVIVLAMAVGGAFAILSPLGVTDPLTAWGVAMAWTCPAARRLIAWRRQTLPGLKVSFDSSSTMIFPMLGLTIWAALPVLENLDALSMLSPYSFPGSIRALGVAFILGGVLRPLWWRRRLEPAPEGALEGVGLLLLTGSPLLAGLAGCGLALRLAMAYSCALRVPQLLTSSRASLAGESGPRRAPAAITLS